MGSFRISRCPKCGGKRVGRLNYDTYFCVDCLLEIELKQSGAIVLYRLTKDGDRKQVKVFKAAV